MKIKNKLISFFVFFVFFVSLTNARDISVNPVVIDQSWNISTSQIEAASFSDSSAVSVKAFRSG